ncbi:MAG: peptidase M48 [Gammaproteobacteria bacterium]|nr:MAG: peptidase M48 [Gammaproteobacteria bacterium]RLA58881.1 MAG: peptidase M48 [Gammaproteobacteria bacterium]
MNFFEQQDIARRNTRVLVLLFLVAVALLIVLTNVAVAAFLFFGQDYNIYSGSRQGMDGFLSYFSWARFGGIGLAVTATVAMVVFIKWIQLSTGGKVVAESMGGTRILPQTRDRAERRCLNVVEEMALAASMPVPPVYVMNGERGINAFAAGTTPADAIVAVTRGTIEHLKRHELQGVIAHEFSHILNGDMRLNIRLAAMLKGITFLGDVGHILLRGSNRHRTGANRSNKNGAALPMLGLALWILGWLGGLAAGFIKAAISRQKEYLADASAVQYTRSSDTIGDALKVIGGYIPGTLVHAARAAEMSHIFFGQIEHHLWQVFATHPPLRQRIERVDPDWNGQYIERKPRHYDEQPSRPGAGEAGVGRAALVAAALAGAMAEEPVQVNLSEREDADFGPSPEQLEEETAARQEIPLVFVQHSHEPLGAHALVFSLLISDHEKIRGNQLNIIAETGITGLADMVFTLSPGVRELGAPRRLPLLEMCLPALKSMSLAQYRLFKNTLLRLIQADQRTELHEWCLFQLIRHYLDPEFVRIKPSRPRYRKLQKVAYHVRVALSVLAHEGSGETESAFRLGADELGFTRMAILPQEQGSVAAFGKAVHELADCYPLLKPRLLKAMTLAASADGGLSPVEREIIASMAAVMDCPVPISGGVRSSFVAL